MSLRTRRSLAFPALLVLLVVACGGGNNPTPTPAGPTAAPTPTNATTPGPTGTGVQPTATPVGPTAVPSPSGDATDQTFRIYCCATDPRSFQPQAASGSDEISIIGGIQRGLLYRDPDGNLVPSLATAMPDVSADGLTYTFHMRPDALYSNGDPIVAADIVAAARSLADPRNAFDYSLEACYLAGADSLMGSDFCSNTDKPTPYLDAAAGTFDDAVINGLLDGLGATAPDAHTVVFTLQQKTSYWNDIIGLWLLTPIDPNETSWAEAADIISSGPFMIGNWVHNSEIDLVPNPNWYGDPVHLSKIEIHIGGDPAAAVAQWEQGGLDEVGVPSSDVRRVLDTPDYSTMINRGATTSIEYYDFADCMVKDSAGAFLCPPNTGVTAGSVPGGSPTQNKDFRIALTQAIDKTELINVAFAGIGVAAYSPTMPGIPGFPTYDATTTPYPFDEASALTHMATALDDLGVAQPDATDANSDGIPDVVAALMATAADGTVTCDQVCATTKARVQLLSPMRFGYNCDAGHDQRVLYMAQQWRTQLGFSGDQMDIRCTDFGTFRTERKAKNIYTISRNGWAADFPHPDNQNRDLFACGAGNNNSGYCNPAYDALLNQGAQAADYTAALPFYTQAEQLLVADAPVFFMRYGEGVRLIRPYVAGLEATPSDHQNVGDVFYESIHILAH